MKKRNGDFLRLSYATGLSLSILINGCVPVPNSSKYYEHEISVRVDDRQYDFKRYLECSSSMDLSEGDGKLHPRWNRSGSGFTTADIGSGRVLVYSIWSDCESDYQDLKVSGSEKPDPYKLDAVRVLDSARNPTRLYILTGQGSEFPVKIEQNSARRVNRIDGVIGSSEAELALKEIVRDSQHGFQRVTVRVVPFEVWSTTEAGRQYFSQFKGVTVARVGEVPPVSGRPDSIVQFPFYRQRNYSRGEHGEVVGLKELDTAYDGTPFVVANPPEPGVQTWYATNETRATSKLNDMPVAVVNYKGVVFRVTTFQEIYDPETKSILQFTNWYTPYPWGAPAPLDLKRLLSGN
jgi:hypothetical protein